MWPSVIVLDTQRIMKAFREHAEQSGKPLDFPDEMVREIVVCLRHARRATLRLDQLMWCILSNEFEHHYAAYADSTVLVFIEELGNVLMDSIIRHNLYDQYGTLHYRYLEPRVVDFNCIILKRSENVGSDDPLPSPTPRYHF